ncbi:MAG: hypothetical protein ACTS46_00450 [Candidatus Hodgkinia cicadicola]
MICAAGHIKRRTINQSIEVHLPLSQSFQRLTNGLTFNVNRT